MLNKEKYTINKFLVKLLITSKVNKLNYLTLLYKYIIYPLLTTTNIILPY